MDNQTPADQSEAIHQSDILPGTIKERHLVVSDSIASGDMIRGDGQNNWVKIPPGSSGQVLTISNGVPTWTTPSVPVAASVNFATSGAQADFTTTSGTLVDVTGATVTIVPTASAKAQAIVTGRVFNGTAINGISVALIIDGVTIQTTSIEPYAVNKYVPFAVSGQATLSSGSRIIKLQANSSGGDTAHIDQANVSVVWS